MITFIHVSSEFQIARVADLANIIWNEHYPNIIGQNQVDYMVDKFQSTKAINQQIEEGYRYHLINYKDESVGYLSIKKNNDDLFLSKIYILKELRGKGIGKAAFSYIENQAKEQNCKSISLTVNKNNIGTVKAYEKIGFKNIGSIVIDIDNGFVMDDYKMIKNL